MSAYTLFIIVLLAIFVLIFMSFHSVNIFRRAIEVSPLYNKKLELDREIKNLLGQIEVAHRTISDLKEERKSMAADVAQAKATIEDGMKEKAWLENYANELSGKKKAIKTIESTLSALTDKCNSLSTLYQKEVDEYADKLKGLEDKRREIEKNIAKLETDRETSLAKVEKSLAEVKKARQAEDDARRDKAAAEQARDRALAEQKGIEVETAKIQRIKENEQEALQRILAKKEAINEEIAGLNLADKRCEKEDLDNKIARLRGELATLEDDKKKRGELDGEVRKLEMRKSQLTGEISDLEQKQQERNKLIGEIATLTGQLDPLRRDDAAIEEKKKFCWQDLDTAIPNIIHNRGLQDDEQDWLESFKKNLKSADIIFPERTLLAFHTGMKVQDYSPMAILAGISGTGKSLLPELYAHAIGMNFLQVAVQPRWDSPQDMLGFYNYMEYRFKATELSRLLWGADSYNNKENAHTSMNLVLLDEMNLARVEYYFSDMLSKLEVRRGLNPANPSERQAAEIELECSAGLPRRRLFIGANTLFVGTMNEDESTQSLSDKVLDRANVIRFGKPAELNVKPDKQKFMAACDTEKMMTLEQWNNWRSAGNDAIARNLKESLQEINNKLMELRRPFGHRVWQSIQAYVENYPGGTAVGMEAFKHALADQIEMKILPKLNGVDKQDSAASQVLADIQSITADQTGDSELVNALKSTIEDPSNAFFQWKGVSR